MEKPRISAIAAIGENRELGRSNKLIWRVPQDFERMQKLTMGHALIMGRKTHESIGRVLAGRTNIVITSDLRYKSEGSLIVHSLEQAVRKAMQVEEVNEVKEIFIFGGSHVYAEALSRTERLYITQIHEGAVDADSYFPNYAEFQTIIEKTDHVYEGVHFSFLTLER